MLSAIGLHGDLGTTHPGDGLGRLRRRKLGHHAELDIKIVQPVKLLFERGQLPRDPLELGLLLDSLLPEGRQALDRIGDFIRERTG